MSLPHPFFVSMSSPRPIPVGSSPATELPSHPACSLALREGEKALRSGGMGMAGLYFFPIGKASDLHRGGKSLLGDLPCPALGTHV